jgi:hypothetical protein
MNLADDVADIGGVLVRSWHHRPETGMKLSRSRESLDTYRTIRSVERRKGTHAPPQTYTPSLRICLRTVTY